MRVGIIDLGTNSVRFSVFRIKASGKYTLLYRSKRVLCLGKEVFSSGRLSIETMEQLIGAFTEFRRISFQLRAKKMLAVATSALRESANGPELAAVIKRRTGINLRIVSGLEEAKIIARGITLQEDEVDGLVALVDIGGGSTEISICQRHRVIHSASFPLGAARLAEAYLPRRSPFLPSPAAAALRFKIHKELQAVIGRQCWPIVPKLIGSSGTIKAVMALRKKNSKSGHLFKAKTVKKIVKTLMRTPQAELRKDRRIPSWRAESTVSAAILLEEITEILGAKRIALTKYSLTEGLLHQQLMRLQLQKATRERHRISSLHRSVARAA